MKRGFVFLLSRINTDYCPARIRNPVHDNKHYGSRMSECLHENNARNANTRRLLWALGVIVVFMLVEAIGGWIAGSLALLADAAHMLTDGVALALAASAQFFATRPADAKLHFGYRRAQVLAAFVNGVLMAMLLFWIVYEAVTRLFHPIEINAPLMLSVAVAGLIANALAFGILHRRHERDLNMRGAMLHVVGDLLGSAAAIVAAVVIWFNGWMQIDPLLSMLVAVLIGLSAFRLIKETGFILLEGAPEGIDTQEMAEGLKKASPLIKDVHHIQISLITPDQPRLTLHACVENAGDSAEALATVKAFLEKEYRIRHSTIQIEIGADCPDRSLGNVAPARAPETQRSQNQTATSDPGTPAFAAGQQQ